MQDGDHALNTAPSKQVARATRGGDIVSKSGSSLLWPVLAGLSMAMAIAAVVAHLMIGPRFDGLLILAAAASSLPLALRVLTREPAPSQPDLAPEPEPLRDVFESAGPAVIAVGLDGRLTYVNPSAERLMGYHAELLMKEWGSFEILASGEGDRLVGELEKLSGFQGPPATTSIARLAVCMQCVRALPPSHVPSFDTQLRRKDGEIIPITLHISALRDSAGVMAGLVAVAIDQSATLRQDEAQRESQERYRDLFESSSEMIAMLSPTGKFLYANPAWKRSFDKEVTELIQADSFEELFDPGCRGQVAMLFRRALDGEQIDRAPLRHHSPDGRVLDLELSLSQRQKSGSAVAIRCLMRDVTQQKQRENRLGLQLMVSQIVGENASPEVAAMRILEALCISQGWDMALKWDVNQEEHRLEFGSAWAVPGRRVENFIQESMGLNIANGEDLPGRAWQDGHPVWCEHLTSIPPTSRVKSALSHEMVSGWAVPVREGNKVLAVLEFYCHFSLREDREALAAVETVAASMGQMLARSREQGRAEELYRQQ